MRNIFKCFVSIKNDHDSIILPPEKADFKASSLERESYFNPGTNPGNTVAETLFPVDVLSCFLSWAN